MKDYRQLIAETIAPYVEGLEISEIREMVEVPADSKMGDYAFPCFKLAKLLRKAPPLIAKSIAEQIAADEMFEKVESVNAYVNMFISRDAFIGDTVREVIAKGDAFGSSDIGAGRKVIVDKEEIL